ncbi:hypothetical protein FJZ31_16830 [Candidatus Poribacteria bacterium]|nr:hypothetical protein [Candidatus Poribacteria bacterium]
MSLCFIGILKLHESAHWDCEAAGPKRDEFSVKLTELALRYGYGIKFHKRHIYWSELEWIDEAIVALGGPKITMLFEVADAPHGEMAHDIFVRELQDPLDWEKVHFPTFLLEIWQQPLVVAALLARVVGAGTRWDISVKELPPPTSIYKVMDEIVAQRTRMDVPTALFYLDKKSLEPFKRT